LLLAAAHIGLFSNVWMDLRMVGGIFETIGYALPFAHAVDAAKGLLMGMPLFGFSINITIVLIYALVLFGLAVIAFRKILDKKF
jgi:ABC-2 type transport system permease protein